MSCERRGDWVTVVGLRFILGNTPQQELSGCFQSLLIVTREPALGEEHPATAFV
jgi:hypothetical protein